MNRTGSSTFDEEQATFDRLLPQLLKTHPGQVAVVHGTTLLGIYTTYENALEASIAAFGPNEQVFMATIEPPRGHILPVALQLGILFS